MFCYGGLSRLGQTPFVLSPLGLPPSWSHSQTNPPLHGGPPPLAAPSNILLAHQYRESQLLFVNSLNEYIEYSVGSQAWITSPHLNPERGLALPERRGSEGFPDDGCTGGSRSLRKEQQSLPCLQGGLESSENVGSCLGSPELILAPRLLIPHPVPTQGAAPLFHSLLQVSPRTSMSPSFQAFLLPPSSLLDPIGVIYHKGTPWAREDGSSAHHSLNPLYSP